MKKLTIIIITTFILGSNSFSQSFAQIDATWHYSYYYLPTITDGYYKITSMGDTIINNKSCRKLLKENIGYNHMQQTYYN